MSLSKIKDRETQTQLNSNPSFPDKEMCELGPIIWSFQASISLLD